MPAQIQALIEKRDNFEILRDEIAAILLLESEKQQEYARLASKDASLWKLRVHVEASNPWAEFLDAPDSDSPLEDTSPIVNVSFESLTFDPSRGNVVERQQSSPGIFNVDCMGYAQSSAKGGGGHEPGDKAAALETQRAVRLVRNILMSSYYVYLGQRGLVGRRWIQSVQAFQPQLDNRQVQHVVAARIALHVDFNEFSPQYVGTPLTLVSTEVTRSGSDPTQILLKADFPLPPPP